MKLCYTNRMTTIKTAVSIEEKLFKRADELAGELQMSRSGLVSLALERFIVDYDTRRLVEILNEEYADGLTEEEQQTMAGMHRLQAELLEDEQW